MARQLQQLYAEVMANQSSLDGQTLYLQTEGPRVVGPQDGVSRDSRNGPLITWKQKYKILFIGCAIKSWALSSMTYLCKKLF